MRQDLVDWMSQQHGTLDLVDETLHLALRYLDTFLVRRGKQHTYTALPTSVKSTTTFRSKTH